MDADKWGCCPDECKRVRCSSSLSSGQSVSSSHETVQRKGKSIRQRLYSGDKIVRSSWLVSSNLTGGCALSQKLAKTQLGLCNSWATDDALWCFQSTAVVVVAKRTLFSIAAAPFGAFIMLIVICSNWHTSTLAYRLADRVSAFLFSFFLGSDWDAIGGSTDADSLRLVCWRVCALFIAPEN